MKKVLNQNSFPMPPEVPRELTQSWGHDGHSEKCLWIKINACKTLESARTMESNRRVGKNEKFKEPLEERVQIASTFGFPSCALTSVGTAASLEALTSFWSTTHTGARFLPSGCRGALPGAVQ